MLCGIINTAGASRIVQVKWKERFGAWLEGGRSVTAAVWQGKGRRDTECQGGGFPQLPIGQQLPRLCPHISKWWKFSPCKLRSMNSKHLRTNKDDNRRSRHSRLAETAPVLRWRPVALLALARLQAVTHRTAAHATLPHRIFRPRQQKKEREKGKKKRPPNFQLLPAITRSHAPWPVLAAGLERGYPSCLPNTDGRNEGGRKQKKSRKGRTRQEQHPVTGQPCSVERSLMPSHISRIDHWRGL